MKAAVITQFGAIPHYENFPDPAVGAGEVSVKVEAVIVDFALKSLAAGQHFGSKQFYPSFPAIVGRSGVGSLSDGTRVMFQVMKSPYGALAERVVVPENTLTVIPPGVDPVQAAVIPSAAQSSLLPLKYTAKLLVGETVLVNGATSVSGLLAVRIAKELGARRIIGTGRSQASAQKVIQAGADAFICLEQSDRELAEAFRRERGDGYDVVLDYLSGRPAEILLSSFVPEAIGFAANRTRYVVIGGLAGSNITFPSQAIITSGVEIYGFGMTNTSENLRNRSEGVALVWDMMKRGVLNIETVKVPLQEIAEAWNMEEHGRRIVIVP